MLSIWVKYFIEVLFGLGMFINAILFVPQAVKIFHTKNTTGVSLTTFAGFNFIQFFTILHAYLNKDYILMWGFLLSFFLCGVVTIMIIFNRFFDKDIIKNGRKGFKPN